MMAPIIKQVVPLGEKLEKSWCFIGFFWMELSWDEFFVQKTSFLFSGTMQVLKTIYTSVFLLFVYHISPETWLQESDEACKSKLRSFGGCNCFFEVGGVDCSFMLAFVSQNHFFCIAALRGSLIGRMGTM